MSGRIGGCVDRICKLPYGHAGQHEWPQKSPAPPVAHTAGEDRLHWRCPSCKSGNGLICEECGEPIVIDALLERLEYAEALAASAPDLARRVEELEAALRGLREGARRYAEASTAMPLGVMEDGDFRLTEFQNAVDQYENADTEAERLLGAKK